MNPVIEQVVNRMLVIFNVFSDADISAMATTAGNGT